MKSCARIVRLCTIQSIRAKTLVRVCVSENVVRDQPQLFEIKKGVRRRQQSDIGGNPEQVRRTQDESDSRKRIPAERAIPRLMISFAAVPPRFRTTFPEANQDCLQHDRQNKERRPDEEDAGVPDRPRGKISKQRPDEGARAVPPAAITGNSRFACPESKSSTRKLQKTETRKRLSTLMKT